MAPPIVPELGVMAMGGTVVAMEGSTVEGSFEASGFVVTLGNATAFDKKSVEDVPRLCLMEGLRVDIEVADMLRVVSIGPGGKVGTGTV